MEPPDVSYARSGDVAVAYQVVGDGPTDILFLGGYTGDLQLVTAGAGEVLASGTVRDLVVGSDLLFEDRGLQPLKGLPDPWRLYAFTDSREA